MKTNNAHIFKILFLTALVVIVLSLCGCSFKTAGNITQSQNTFNTPEGCFSCLFFRIIYNGVGEFTNKLYDTMCDYGKALLAIGLFMWTMIHVLKLISSLREPNIAQFWVLLFQTWFKCGLVAAFISTKNGIIYIISNILESISTLIISIGGEILDMNWLSADVKAVFMDGFKPAPGFSEEVGLQLENLIYRIQLALNGGRVLGLKLFLGDDMANICLGTIVLIIFTLMSIFFPFYLIDGLIRLAFVFAMLPIFLVCWCFRSTAEYMTKAFAMFMGAFLQITLACVFVAIAVAVMEGFVSVRALEYMIVPATQDSNKIVFAEAERMSVSFVAFVFIAIYIYDLSKRVGFMTAHFTGAPGQSIMGGLVERFKSATRAMAWTAVAIGSYFLGAAPLAKVATEHAKEEGEDAAKGKNE